MHVLVFKLVDVIINKNQAKSEFIHSLSFCYFIKTLSIVYN